MEKVSALAPVGVTALSLSHCMGSHNLCQIMFIQSQKANEVTLGFYFHFLNQLDKWLSVGMSFFQRVYIFDSPYRGNDDWEVTALDEECVHNKAGYSAVSIHKRVDEHKLLMCQGG